MPNLVSIQIG